MATIRSGLLAPSAPLFAPLSVLFEQRILVVLNSGLFPKPSFADFQANFQSERYQPRELLQQAISSFEEAQRGAVQLAPGIRVAACPKFERDRRERQQSGR